MSQAVPGTKDELNSHSRGLVKLCFWLSLCSLQGSWLVRHLILNDTTLLMVWHWIWWAGSIRCPRSPSEMHLPRAKVQETDCDKYSRTCYCSEFSRILMMENLDCIYIYIWIDNRDVLPCAVYHEERGTIFDFGFWKQHMLGMLLWPFTV